MANSQRRNNSGSVAVVGAGIRLTKHHLSSGLAAAHRLYKEGVSVTVFETEGNVGGKLRSQLEDGYIWDFGANSMMENSPEVGALIDELNLREKLQVPAFQKKRYIVLGGSPVLIPSNPFGIIGSKVLSTKAKLQIILEPFLWKRKPEVADESKDERADECVGDFIARHLGTEAVETLIDPFIAGTTGSDPKSLSARLTFPELWALEQSHGSLLVGGVKSRGKKQDVTQKTATTKVSSTDQSNQIRGSFSFTGGLQTLALALAERIGRNNVELNTAVVSLATKQQGNPARDEWTVSLSKTESKKTTEANRHFDAVVLTVPLHNLKSIQFHKDGKNIPLDFIPEVVYQPMSVVITAFNKEDVKRPLEGFGVVVPSKEQANGFQTLGTLFSSSMYPDRAPSDQIMFTSFVGGNRNRDLAAAPLSELKDVVMKDLKQIAGVDGEPLTVRHFYWDRAFPQYGLKYGDVLDSLVKLESSFPGVFYAGNHRGGLAVGKALLSGHEAAGRVLESLAASGGRIFTMV